MDPRIFQEEPEGRPGQAPLAFETMKSIWVLRSIWIQSFWGRTGRKARPSLPSLRNYEIHMDLKIHMDPRIFQEEQERRPGRAPLASETMKSIWVLRSIWIQELLGTSRKEGQAKPLSPYSYEIHMGLRIHMDPGPLGGKPRKG